LGDWAIWRFGDLAIWGFGDWAIWGFGDLAIWRFGDLAIWRFGDWAIWGFGDLAIWGFGDWAIWGIGGFFGMDREEPMMPMLFSPGLKRQSSSFLWISFPWDVRDWEMDGLGDWSLVVSRWSLFKAG
jgi:hypothetical protein